MKGEPEVLTDTIIRGTKYMRVKFSKLNRPSGYYSIGYLRYDNKGKLFSLNKNFSSKVNCTMTRYDEFKETGLAPFATTELEFLSDTLSANELRVFQAWKENAKKDNNYWTTWIHKSVLIEPGDYPPGFFINFFWSKEWFEIVIIWGNLWVHQFIWEILPRLAIGLRFELWPLKVVELPFNRLNVFFCAGSNSIKPWQSVPVINRM